MAPEEKDYAHEETKRAKTKGLDGAEIRQLAIGPVRFDDVDKGILVYVLEIKGDKIEEADENGRRDVSIFEESERSNGSKSPLASKHDFPVSKDKQQDNTYDNHNDHGRRGPTISSLRCETKWQKDECKGSSNQNKPRYLQYEKVINDKRYGKESMVPSIHTSICLQA